jgi:hypothetical protein
VTLDDNLLIKLTWPNREINESNQTLMILKLINAEIYDAEIIDTEINAINISDRNQ